MTMTNYEEEQLLLDKLLDARHKVQLAKDAVSLARMRQSEAEHALSVIEQAVYDYCDGNGLMKFESMNHTVSYGLSASVDVADPSAVPDEFMRVKTVREPNKQLIAASRPQGNWYVIKQSPKITVRSK